MRAYLHESYGPPELLRWAEDVPSPSPRAGEILLEVRASSVCGDDWHLLEGLPYAARLATGLRRPRQRIPGLDVAGHVLAVGHGVSSLAVGDEVFGWCRGAHAERVCVPADQLVAKPASVSFEEAAVLPVSGFTALQALRDAGQLKAGQRLLIIGASGGVGSLAVQLGKALGAHVTGICSAPNVPWVTDLGADAVLDYTAEDFSIVPQREDERYDVIVDLAQAQSLAACRRALAPKGILVLAGSSGLNSDLTAGRSRWFKGTDRWLKALALSPFISQTLRPLVHQDRRADLLELAALVESGALRPLVDRCFPLEALPEAITYTTKRRARGIVAISVGAGS